MVKRVCIKCGSKEKKIKHKKLKEGWLCSKCIAKKRKEHREFLKREICGIRKREDILREAKERREKEKLIRESKPKIKPIKNPIKKSKKNHLYITKEEKLLLYKKFISQGLTKEQASNKIQNVCNEMRELTIRLKEDSKNKEAIKKELNKKFLEELYNNKK